MPFASECFWAFQTRATFWAIFEKFPLVPSLYFFYKMRVLGDLGKIAITWPFPHFWSRCLRQNLLQLFHFKRILNTGECLLHQSAIEPFKQAHLFWRLLKNFFWSPLCSFSENEGLGVLAKIAITWPFGQFWSRVFARKSSPVFAF